MNSSSKSRLTAALWRQWLAAGSLWRDQPFPRALSACIWLSCDAQIEEGAAAIELAARLGLEAGALRLPVVRLESSASDHRVAIDPGDGIAWFLPGAPSEQLYLARRLASGAVDDAPERLWEPDTVTPRPKGGHPEQTDLAMLYTVGGLLGSRDGLQPDLTRIALRLHGWESAADLAALANLAARIGCESTGLFFPVTVLPWEAVPEDAIVIELEAQQEAKGTADIQWDGQRLTVRGDGRARTAALVYLAAIFPYLEEYVPGAPALSDVQEGLVPAPPRTSSKSSWTLTWEGEWEIDRVRRVWRENVLPALTADEPVTVEVRVSEPIALRAALADELRGDIHRLGLTGEVRVSSVLKQGYYWIVEEILPALRDLPCARIELAVSRFPASGAPREAMALTAGGPQEEARGLNLEMPIRWLQELYPVDGVVARELGLADGTISFSLVDNLGATWELQAYDAHGRLLLRAANRAACTRRPYLPDDPAAGWVHPPCGLLRVQQGHRVVADVPIATDGELFWDWYQRAVLPRLASVGARRDCRDGDCGTLRVDVWLSEEDRELPVRQERVSGLDPLHEDIYFYTLDFLSRTCGEDMAKGGASALNIQPWVHAAPGERPRAQVAWISATGAQARQRPPIVGLRIDTSGRVVALQTRSGWQSVPAVIDELHDVAPAESVPATLVTPENLPAFMSRLRNRGLWVWKAGRSTGGWPLYAVASLPVVPGWVAPPSKLSALRPTVLICGRHHANEISSTPALLQLAEALAEEGELAALARRVNVIMLPLENADGAMLHAALQAEHPRWKLHAARFNICGVEFGHHYFRRESSFTEARALPELWRTWLPDVVIDNHGVPSHEWIQLFSGYNSAPYFPVSYWIPNAVLYTIFSSLPDPEPGAVRLRETVRWAIARALQKDTALYTLNQALLNVYENYGHRWLPERFPLECAGNTISYIRPVPTGPDARTFHGRYPHITCLEMITEVPDETAQGEHLALCVRAQRLADETLLRIVADVPAPVIRTEQASTRGGWCNVGRRRPLSSLL